MSREALENSNTFYAEVASGEDMESMLCIKSTRAISSKHSLQTNEMQWTALLSCGELEEGQACQAFELWKKLPVKSGGTCPKSTWMEACFVISHGTAPDSRRLQAKLEAFKLLWTCFKYALYVWSSESVFEWRHFIYFIDSVDCGLFCGFFCVSFSLHTEVWCERGLCGRSWTSWVDQLLLGCKMLHGFTSRTS